MILNSPKKDTTNREEEVLRVLINDPGIQDKEIASILGVAPRTIKFHMTNLREKYGVHTRRELIKAAKRVIE